MAKTVDMKDTKATILEAYHSVLERLNEQKSTKMRPQEKIAKEKETNLVNEASSKLQTLTSFSSKIDAVVADFSNLEKAVEVKKEELKNLFDIEAEALSLAALIDSNQELKTTLSEENKVYKAQLNNELDNLRTLISEERIKNNTARQRNEAEYSYDFERTKKQKLDDLQDELDQMKKSLVESINAQQAEINEKNKEMGEREEAIDAAEAELIELKEQVENIPEKIAEAVKSAVGKTTGMMQSKLEAEKKFFERDIAAKLELSTAATTALETENGKLTYNIVELQTKLDDAYKEIKNMAIKTVEGAGNSSMFNEMKTLLTEKQGK